MTDPHDTLTRVGSLLADGGRLIVAVPDNGGRQTRLLRPDCGGTLIVAARPARRAEC